MFAIFIADVFHTIAEASSVIFKKIADAKILKLERLGFEI